MELLNKYTPKRLSTDAYNFIMFANSEQMKQLTQNKSNTASIILKEYNKIHHSNIKPTNARNWINNYEVIEGFIIKYDTYDDLRDDLNKQGQDIYNKQIMSIEEAEEMRENALREHERRHKLTTFTIQNVIIDPTLKRDYDLQKQLK